MKKQFLKRFLAMGMTCVLLLTGSVPASAAVLVSDECVTTSNNSSLLAVVEPDNANDYSVVFSSLNLKTKKTLNTYSTKIGTYLNYSNNVWYKTVLSSYDKNGNKLSAKTYYMAKSPKLNKLKLYKGKRKIKVSWPKTSGATGYVVYRKVGSGSFKKVATTKKNYYVTGKLKYHTNYYFYVRSYKKVNGKTWYSAMPEDNRGGYIYKTYR